MKLLLLLFFCCIGSSSRAQDIHEIKYSFPEDPAKTIFTGFVLSYGHSFDFARLSGTVKGTRVIYDLEFNPNEQREIHAAATNDSFIFCKAPIIRTITGKGNRSLNSLIIWLKRNKATGKFEIFTGKIPFTTIDNPAMLGGKAFIPVSPTKQQNVNQSVNARPDKNGVISFRKLNQARFDKAYLQDFFSSDELKLKSSFTKSELDETRRKEKPVMHFISVNSNEKLSKFDTHKLSYFFEGLAESLDIHCNRIILEGTAFNVKEVTRQIRELSTKSNDIIIFSYSGHGFSYQEDDQNKFPQLALWHGDISTQALMRENSINLEEIYKMIKSKKARLNLVMGDCCNNIVEIKRREIIPTGDGVFGPLEKYWNTRAVASLLLDTRNSFLLAAATKGEKAAAHSWYGGFFTFSVINAMHESLQNWKSNDPKWDRILLQAREEALALSQTKSCDGVQCKQHMISAKDH